MKNLACVSLLLISLFSCTETPKNTSASETPKEVVSDSTAIANTIHGFYKWYDAFSNDSTKRIDFAEEKSKHLSLNTTKMEKYFSYFKESGFVSDVFIQNEYAFYKKCDVFWQKESVGDVPSCLDADKYYCAQDWDNAFWTSSAVKIKKINADSVWATLNGTHFDTHMERNFELKKENGKWVLTKIECDMGMNY